MRVFFFWEPVGGITLQHKCNPYAGLLALELEKTGIYLELGEYELDKSWLEDNRKGYDVLHLHWLHYFYRRDSLEASVAAYGAFAERLTYAKKVLGYKVVWTLHNVYPHERPYPDLDHAARLLVCDTADAVLCHCNYAKGIAERLFYRTENVHIVPHGNFIDAFPNRVSRADAREKFGIRSDQFVYLFFGNARAYKGIEKVVQAFRERADSDAVLLLMMRVAFDPTYADEVEAIAQKDERIRVFTSPFFPESDFQYYINTADVCVFPFAEVLTSGSAITALSFGCPVILPRLGCLPELIDEDMGVLYDVVARDGLGDALVAVRNLDLEAGRKATYERALGLNWQDIATLVADIYRA
jgi:beta-1,4-mannosyltransferase